MKCKFCGSEDIICKNKIKSPYIEKLYSLYECKKCRNRFFLLNEHPEVNIRAIYEKEAVQNSLRYKVEFVKSRKWLNEVSEIRKLLGQAPSSILDIGCRTGDFLLHWNPPIRRVGIEVAKYSADIARMRGGLEVKNNFLENVKFGCQFEVVTCYAILEHLEDPMSFLHEISQLVQPGGILVIMVPAYQSFKEKIFSKMHQRWHMYSPPEHLNFFSEKFLSSVIREDFFLLKKKYTTGGMINPLRNIWFFWRFGQVIFSRWDECSFLNQWPIFDHMYLYYQRRLEI